MGTPCSIIAQTSDGVKSIRVNYDGGRGMLEKLKTNYTEQTKIDALMNLGDLSSLYESPECPIGHSYNHPERGFCIAYGRDRGEDDVEFERHDSQYEAMQEVIGNENFTYMWNGTTWEKV